MLATCRNQFRITCVAAGGVVLCIIGGRADGVEFAEERFSAVAVNVSTVGRSGAQQVDITI